MLSISSLAAMNPRWKAVLAFVAVSVVLMYSTHSKFEPYRPSYPSRGQSKTVKPQTPMSSPITQNTFAWLNVTQQFGVTSMRPVPTGVAGSIPKLQYQFAGESMSEREVRVERLAAVRSNFTHAWKGYRSRAWMKDTLRPISGKPEDLDSGWATSLVDSLDSLWIMGMHEEFVESLAALQRIDFSTKSYGELNVFEATTRFLGGMLSAYDLSGQRYPLLLRKAIEIGDMLMLSFDTPNRMPITRWNFKNTWNGVIQEAGESVIVSEIGSLSLEFTRLSQLTGDPKYFDAVQTVMDLFADQQDETKLPGMWPVVVNARDSNFGAYSGFAMGGMADSLYEYLPKQHILLGGSTQQYRRMYEYAMIAVKRNLLFRPMIHSGEDVRLVGQVESDGFQTPSTLITEPVVVHQGCFAGGMVAMASKIFLNPDEMELAKKLVHGCLWANEVMPLGLMPERMHVVPCKSLKHCPWEERKWHHLVHGAFEGPQSIDTKITKHRLQPGVAIVDDSHYLLRPETIESVFVLYRITGDPTLLDRAWVLFESIVTNTNVTHGYAQLEDCTIEKPPKRDHIDSHWMSETLKYFFLLFSEPDVTSLDDYVFNTKGHPLKRPY